jgi:hypothetical protein
MRKNPFCLGERQVLWIRFPQGIYCTISETFEKVFEGIVLRESEGWRIETSFMEKDEGSFYTRESLSKMSNLVGVESIHPLKGLLNVFRSQSSHLS